MKAQLQGIEGDFCYVCDENVEKQNIFTRSAWHDVAEMFGMEDASSASPRKVKEFLEKHQSDYIEVDADFFVGVERIKTNRGGARKGTGPKPLPAGEKKERTVFFVRPRDVEKVKAFIKSLDSEAS